MFLADFSVIKPDPGLIFWTAVIFLGLWTFLARTAWKPISKALREREGSIENSLAEAEKARDEMKQLTAQNEQILNEAREEKSAIIRQAKESSERMIVEAREKSKEEASKILANARQEIENQKNAAMADLKNQSGALALDIAEKILKKELKGNSEHETFVNKLVDEINLS